MNELTPDFKDLPPELKKATDDMVKRRMKNTGETWEQACKHLADYLRLYAEHLCEKKDTQWKEYKE